MSIARLEAESIYQPPTICSGQYDREARVRAYIVGRLAKASEAEIEDAATVIGTHERSYVRTPFPPDGMYVHCVCGRKFPDDRAFDRHVAEIIYARRAKVVGR